MLAEKSRDHTELKASKVGRLSRYFVADISPIDRKELQALRPHYIFVAESPHVNEVEPERIEERRPLCGAAGRQWWSKLGAVLEGVVSEDVTLKRMEAFCLQHAIVVMNAVQFPLDPKITVRFPEADPVRNLGFAKAAGEFGYKRLKKSSKVQGAIRNLRERLLDPRLAGAMVWPLGNDAEWFVSQALTGDEYEARVKGKVYHPSAWWRQGGLFGRVADEKLGEIFLKQVR